MNCEVLSQEDRGGVPKTAKIEEAKCEVPAVPHPKKAELTELYNVL